MGASPRGMRPCPFGIHFDGREWSLWEDFISKSTDTVAPSSKAYQIAENTAPEWYRV